MENNLSEIESELKYQHIRDEVIDEIKERSTLISGDNIDAMKLLLKTKIRFDLCYIDPPFATGNTFRTSKGRTSTISPAGNDEVAYTDKLKGQEFVDFIKERAILIRELLTPQGSFYIHTDYKIGHYLKVMLDEVFGIENFRNDITRIKCNPKNFNRNAYGNVKDMILFYTKTKSAIWNEQFDQLSEAELTSSFKKQDSNGRYYNTVPIHAPGETKSGPTSQPWRGIEPPKGRHWRCSPVELDELEANGLIEWSRTGNPRRIVYADQHKGKKIQDIWNFKDPMYPKYPTEKNLDLIKLIISTSSNKDSFVLDAFCGGGTTLIAANLLGRKWVGIDQSNKAISVTEKRLEECSFMNIDSKIQRIKL